MILGTRSGDLLFTGMIEALGGFGPGLEGGEGSLRLVSPDRPIVGALASFNGDVPLTDAADGTAWVSRMTRADFLLTGGGGGAGGGGPGLTFNETPEPSAVLLLGAGVVALLGCEWRRRGAA